MQTTVLEPGRAVKVGPSEVSATDILDYAEALIEEEGWNQMKDGERQESGSEVGWTLHDAIGEANRRLFPSSMGGQDKEGIRMASGETTRQAATAALNAVLPKTAADDKTFNDKAKSKAEVIKVLQKAKEELAKA